MRLYLKADGLARCCSGVRTSAAAAACRCTDRAPASRPRVRTAALRAAALSLLAHIASQDTFRNSVSGNFCAKKNAHSLQKLCSREALQSSRQKSWFGTFRYNERGDDGPCLSRSSVSRCGIATFE